MRLPHQNRTFGAFQKIKWRLTLSYLLVTLAAIFMLAWWGLVAGTLYLQRSSPDLSWFEVIQKQVLPALGVILPSSLILIIPASLVSVYFGFLTARWLDLRLANLRQAVQAWQQGDFSVKVSDSNGDEIHAFGQELDSMASELERLLNARADLAALEERNHLSRDLHDSVKQQITAASFQIGSANALLDQNLQAARASLTEAENLVHAAHQELNSIIFELRPAETQSGNLAQVLQNYTASWARQNAVQLHLQISGEIDGAANLTQEILRFVQEALSNISRHSRAEEVRMDVLGGETEMILIIQDNGCGFELDLMTSEGLGLRTMRERITRLGGNLQINSQPGHGTQITAAIPLINTRKMNRNDA